MPKYIRRTRSSNASSSDKLRDALLRDLEKEGEKMLKKMASQFTRDLEKESSRVLQSLLPGGKGSSTSGLGSAGLEAATNLIGSLVTYAISKPKTTTSTRESDRSKNEDSQFRLSRSQAMAEATAQLARSDRNY